MATINKKTKRKEKMKEKSEFGKGLVICLCKFVEHSSDLSRWINLYELMRKDHPNSFEEKMAVESWANGASDHLYEIETPRRWKKDRYSKKDHISFCVKFLKEHGLEVGHGFTNRAWRKKHGEDLIKWAYITAKHLGFLALWLIKMSDKFSIHRLRPIDEKESPWKRRNLSDKVRVFIHWNMLKLIHRLAWLYDWILGLRPDIGEW